MITIGIGQMLAALLLIINALFLIGTGHPLLMFVDLVAAAVFIWTGFGRDDPPYDFQEA